MPKSRCFINNRNMIKYSTGTDGIRVLCHQFVPSSLSRRAHCLRKFSTCFLRRNQLREAILR